MAADRGAASPVCETTLISRELWVWPKVAGKTRVSWLSSRAGASVEWCWPRIGLCGVAGAHYGGGGP